MRLALIIAAAVALAACKKPKPPVSNFEFDTAHLWSE